MYLFKIFILLILPIFSIAFSMDSCSVGKTVYIDDWHDKEVIIQECDYSDNTIKVKDLSGNIKWVKPSELLGKFGKEVEDFFEDILIDMGEDIVKEMVKGPNKNSNGDYYIYLENQCDKTIKFALKYKTTYGTWKTNGWWEMKPNKGSYLSSNGTKLTSNSSIAYFYAETTSGDIVWKGDDATEYFDGETLHMQKQVDSYGSMDFLLTCGK